MTEEQATKLGELVEDFTTVDKICGVIYIIAIVTIIAFWIYQIYRTKLISKWRREYKATLSQEQLDAIEKLNKIH